MQRELPVVWLDQLDQRPMDVELSGRVRVQRELPVVWLDQLDQRPMDVELSGRVRVQRELPVVWLDQLDQRPMEGTPVSVVEGNQLLEPQYEH